MVEFDHQKPFSQRKQQLRVPFYISTLCPHLKESERNQSCRKILSGNFFFKLVQKATFLRALIPNHIKLQFLLSMSVFGFSLWNNMLKTIFGNAWT